ncbi:hypothetical protein RHGRI_024930 [Rhododendron griersonianum]|uniref:Photosystem I subunit VII n=1 Tax=Rhododendron griersonianum TaxID=479676 RepID=A0AAV6JCL1_9ERIC|nr:hypothetical protein RHGRI_024930 [Rhododendron griersonianum]
MTFLRISISQINNPRLRYDYGKFYASKTFYDSNKKRRICGAGLRSRCLNLNMSNKDGFRF